MPTMRSKLLRPAAVTEPDRLLRSRSASSFDRYASTNARTQVLPDFGYDASQIRCGVMPASEARRGSVRKVRCHHAEYREVVEGRAQERSMPAA